MMLLVRNTSEPPCDDAIRLAQSVVYIVIDDNSELASGSQILTNGPAVAAIMKRKDLPEDHPLYNERAMVSVPSGYGDIVLNDNGELEFYIEGEIEASSIYPVEKIRT
jgi:hypothetical protein